MSQSENPPQPMPPTRPDSSAEAASSVPGDTGAPPAAPRPVLTEKQAKRATSSAVAMLLSTVFLMAVVAGFLLLSPSPPEPARQDRVDVAVAAEQLRAAEGVPALAPQVPEDWTSSFARWTTQDGVSSWAVGWVASEDVFVGMEQAPEANPTWTALRVDQAPAQAPVEVGGVSWTPHDPEGRDLFWAGEVDGSTVVLTTTGDEASLRRLAEAVAQAAG